MIPAAAAAGGGGGGGGASASPYFPQNQQLFHSLDGMYAAAFMGAEPAVFDTHCHALLHNLSLLKDKVQQLHPLVGLAVAHDGHAGPVAVSGAGAIIHEIIAAASSMMYAFQQLCGLGASSVNNAAQEDGIAVDVHHGVGHAKNGTAADVGGCSDQVMDHVVQQWQQHHGGNYNHTIHGRTEAVSSPRAAGTVDTIIELDAAELLAKYTHYCQVCGKGFKRDANLRMHMRAHGDEYKSNAALANPTKASGGEDAPAPDAAAAATGRKYSCPQEGCRWNRKHAKFQPLKSVICVKNHYKRSHCPKMYVCNRCNRKQFSVLSDLRTHEKHCGDHRWICSCGTTFSRKDKLVGHVALFAGHEPAVPLEGLGGKHGKRSSSSSELGKGSSGGNIGIGNLA